MKKQQYLLGSFYILLVNALWVLSGVFAQLVFNVEFKEPFVVTFYSNLMFAINLIFYLPMLWNQCTSADEKNERYSKLDAVLPSAVGSQEKDSGVHFDFARKFDEKGIVLRTDGGGSDMGNRQLSIQSGVGEWPDEETERTTCCFFFIVKQSSRNMSIKKTFWLGALFCPIWFVMNYLYNRSLMGTSLGNTTGLSILSGPFCMVLSWIFLGKPLVLANVGGTAFMIVGAVLIIKCDERKTCAFDSWYGDSTRIMADFLAILSALAYACYGILMKLWVGDGTKTSMPLLFGFIGICNLIFLWPIFIFLNFTNFELVEMPPTSQLWLILTVMGLFSILSDYFMARAIVLTTPLIVNVGLSLSIPAAVLIDMFNGKNRLFEYNLGVVCLVAGFLLVNINAARNLKQKREYVSYFMSTKRILSFSSIEQR